MHHPAAASRAAGGDAGPRACLVAPRHRADPAWPWVTGVEPMSAWPFQRLYIDNTFTAAPRLTRLYQWHQYRRAAATMADLDLAYIFSTGVAAGVTGWPALGLRRPATIYVGFTQDGHWPARRIRSAARALRTCSAVTVFSEEERRVLLPRYRLHPQRVHVVPIHTDETEEYRQYSGPAPRPDPYVVALGSPNRRFMPVALACEAMRIPLVVITRPWHRNDSLAALAAHGATVITDADKMTSLTWLKHARLAVMAFDDPTVPGGFTTLVHAMFLGTPFVVTQCLGMAEHVIDGQTGFVTPHGDQESLSRAIDRLWSEPGLAREFAERGRERATQRHSLAAAARAFHELGGRVISAGG
jgi:glycosyltransferase involved in cell wall biosynthesis